jgi:hypothetical protein
MWVIVALGCAERADPIPVAPRPSHEGSCQTSAECRLQVSGCQCLSVGATEMPEGPAASCPMPDACGALGLDSDDAICAAGRCVLNRRCDDSDVGLPLAECGAVTSCDLCERAGLRCVGTRGHGPNAPVTHHCVTEPPECAGTPTCACLKFCPEPSECWDPSLTCVRY